MRTLILIFILLPGVSFSQTINLQAENYDQKLGCADCVFLSAGPKKFVAPPPNNSGVDTCAAKSYRVAFILNEIYYSIAFDELNHEGVECSDVKIMQTVILNGFDIGNKIASHNRITDIHFKRWYTWNIFSVEVEGSELFFTILDNGNIEINKPK